MTATRTAPAVVPGAVPALRVYRFELVKLLSQWRTRLLVLAAWVGPAVVVSAIAAQSTLPADTVFGRWMQATGWAGSLVVLAFSGTWALPLLTSLVAGDVFAAEDRLGTWRHLVVAVRSPGRIFLAKALASLTVILLLVTGLAGSGAAAGVLVVGDRPLIGLDGSVLAPGDAAVRVLLAWGCALAPTLALAGIGLLGSVTLGRSPMGLLLPVVVALGMQVAQLLPLPVAVRMALPGYAFLAWRGLFATPAQLGPVLVALAVSLLWAAVTTAAAYRLFVRRDFTTADPGVGRRGAAVAVLPLVALLAVTVAVITPVGSGAGSGIEQGKLQDSLATAFAHLYRVQTRELHRPDVTEAQLATSATCAKGDGLAEATGPGNGWRCVVSWHLPGVSATGTATYQLDVAADGRYVADGDGPREVNGYFVLHSPTGNTPNPLWQFDGLVDLLASAGKG